MLEINDYYNFSISDLGVLLLDASKAFDRVNYCKLFNELLKRNISPVLLSLLYIQLSHCVLNGVTQHHLNLP